MPRPDIEPDLDPAIGWITFRPLTTTAEFDQPNSLCEFLRTHDIRAEVVEAAKGFPVIKLRGLPNLHQVASLLLAWQGGAGSASNADR